MFRKTTIASLFITLTLGHIAAASDQNFVSHTTRNQRYLNWHNECLSLDIDTIDRKIAQFEAVMQQDPQDHLAEAYLGSAHALKAKAAFWPPTKVSNLKRGKHLIDHAVQSDPHNPRVRLVRAIAYFRVPKIFECRSISLSDFDTLVPGALKGTLKLSSRERQAMLYYAALAYKEDGRDALAQQCKATCHRIDPNSKYGKLTTP